MNPCFYHNTDKICATQLVQLSINDGEPCIITIDNYVNSEEEQKSKYDEILKSFGYEFLNEIPEEFLNQNTEIYG